MTDSRFDRQERLFGRAGQERIEATCVALVGVGGTGTQVVQSLVLLGVRRFILIEPGTLKVSSRNRYVGHRHDDPVGMSKLAIAERMIRSISPAAEILGIDKRVEANESLDVLKRADVVFGCLDDEGPRFMLNSVCAEYGKRLIDVATEIIPARNGEPVRYGGRVFVLWERPGCLVCCDLIDMEEAKRQLASSAEQENRRSVYGVNREDLNGVGPSVAPLNGTIASIATTEFLLAITGLRHPIRLTTYRADLGRFTVAKDSPRQGCYTCLSATPLS